VKMNNGVSGTPRLLSLLFAVGLLGLLGTMGTFALMAASSGMGGIDIGGMMDGGHMGGMMGSGGRNSTSDPSQQGSAEETIIIEDFAYSPGNLQVPLGARVTWTNRDSAPHSATDTSGTWDTGVLAKGKSATLSFDKAGTFSYYCTVHPSMKARLTVQ
jgi:plastocyanin